LRIGHQTAHGADGFKRAKAGIYRGLREHGSIPLQ
jgi:hypothetical protein